MSTHLASIQLAAGTTKEQAAAIWAALRGVKCTYEVSATTGLQTLHVRHPLPNSHSIHGVIAALPHVLAYTTDEW